VNPYTHLTIAKKLEPQLQPEKPQDYYLGAVLPDIRYYSKILREQTHISIDRVGELATHHPQLQSFATGYTVHLLTDQFASLTNIIFRRFPFNLLKRKLPSYLAPILIECYYLETGILRDIQISESSNEALDSLGIKKEDVTAFAKLLNRFLATPSFALGLTTLQNLGMLNRSGVEKQIKAAQTIQDNRLIKKLLFASIDVMSFEQQIISNILSSDAITKQLT
jgi:hypothetical protein